MKKYLIFTSLIAVLLISGTVFFSSCIKNRNDIAVDFNQLASMINIQEGGLNNFGTSALHFPAVDHSDTAYFRINYASSTGAPNDILITLAIDDAALAAYNAANPTATYQKMPDSIFKFIQTSITIKAGQQNSDAVKLIVYPNKIDFSKNYMLCISITNISGNTVSGNFGTKYYHIVGNPLAGSYNMTGIRINYNGYAPWTGPPTPYPSPNVGVINYSGVIVASMINATTIQFDMGMGDVPEPFTGFLLNIMYMVQVL